MPNEKKFPFFFQIGAIIVFLILQTMAPTLIEQPLVQIAFVGVLLFVLLGFEFNTASNPSSSLKTRICWIAFSIVIFLVFIIVSIILLSRN